MSIASQPAQRASVRPHLPRRSPAELAPRGRAGGVYLRLLAACRSPQLDRELAAGADPGTSALLALRAQQLTGRRSRKRLADGLHGALCSAQHATPGFTAAVRPHPSELFAARTVLATLERRLRGPDLVTPQGVAVVRMLLTDATGPLYTPGEPGALADRLRRAAAALEPS